MQTTLRTGPLLLTLLATLIVQVICVALSPRIGVVPSQIVQCIQVILFLLLMLKLRMRVSPLAAMWVKTAIGLCFMAFSVLLVQWVKRNPQELVESLVDSLFYFGLFTVAAFGVPAAISSVVDR